MEARGALLARLLQQLVRKQARPQQYISLPVCEQAAVESLGKQVTHGWMAPPALGRSTNSQNSARA